MKKLFTKNDKVLMGIAAGFALMTLITSIPIANKNLGQLLGLTNLLFLLAFVMWHATMRYGVKGMAVFLGIVFVVSNVLENLSIFTGFPFGNYHYVPGTLPFLFAVPVPIALAYCAYGYLAWMVANVLLGTVDDRLKQWALTVILPLTAAFVMVMWDVVMDPINSTVRHYWIWEQGGGYNGVPLTNYLGWFLTVYLFYQFFALYVRANTGVVRRQPGRTFWAAPIVLYLVTGLSFLLMYLFAVSAPIVDATGAGWDTKAIYETAVIASIFTMLFTSFLALVKLRKNQ